MRKSIVTEYAGICAFCGAPAECEHHLLFGNGIRKLAEADGIKLPSCNKCHNLGALCERIHDNPMAETLSKMVGQLAWEKEAYKSLVGATYDQARNEFRKRYGQSYL